jgi:hypothetical protein
VGELLDRIRSRTGQTVEPSLPLEDEEIFDPELIPDVTPTPRSDEDDQIDALLLRLGIVDAYRRWCGKMEPNVGNKTESIMVSCPYPGHVDNEPSAWVNSDKNAGNCALCGGFDRYDLAAWHFGFPVPGYKTNGQFPELRRRIAGELGLTITRTPAGAEIVQHPPEEDDKDEQAPPARKLSAVPDPTPGEDEAELNDTAIIPSEDDDDEVAYIVPPPPSRFVHVPLDWESCILPGSTFLKTWMDLCREDDLPEEYYFFLGLMALAAACGNDIVLKDREPVRGNLMLCLVGPSGLGKSRSTRALRTLLQEAFPFDKTGGCKWIANVGSAESLVDEFNVEEDDGSGNLVKVPVRGVLRFDELATLTQKSNRQGSTIKPMVMEFYDSPDEIHTLSRTHGSSRARNHFFQMVSSTQPDIISRLLTDTDAVSGFLNRWVFVTGTTKMLVAWGGDVIDIEDAVIPLKDIRIWGMTYGKPLILETDAVERFSQFFHEILVPLKLDSETPLFARSDLLMKKLMLLMAVDQKKAYVSVETVEVCIKIWEYLLNIYTFVQEESRVEETVKKRNSLEDDVLRVALLHFSQTKKNATMRDIQRRLGPKWKTNGLPAYMQATKDLCVSGQLWEYTEKNAQGRQVTRYKVVM